MGRQIHKVPHQLPPRPEGFVGKLDYRGALSDEFRPKQSPRQLKRVATADFSDGPGSDAYFSYYLYSQRHYWMLYVYLSYDGSEELTESQKWTIYCYAKKGKETAETAAVYLLMDAWREEEYDDPPLIENEGVLSVADLVLICQSIWGRDPNISKSIGRKVR